MRGAGLASGRTLDPRELERQAVRANVLASAEQLRHGSELIEQLARDDGLVIVGAEYSVETGAVEFLDGSPEID